MVVVIGTTGNDDTFGSDVAADTVWGGNGIGVTVGTGNDTLNGLCFNDTLYGGDGNDTVHGGQNDDLLYGGDGNDELFVHLGATDTAYGGAGNDFFNTNTLAG